MKRVVRVFYSQNRGILVKLTRNKQGWMFKMTNNFHFGYRKDSEYPYYSYSKTEKGTTLHCAKWLIQAILLAFIDP